MVDYPPNPSTVQWRWYSAIIKINFEISPEFISLLMADQLAAATVVIEWLNMQLDMLRVPKTTLWFRNVTVVHESADE